MSQLGLLFPIYGKIIQMFQTTNQIATKTAISLRDCVAWPKRLILADFGSENAFLLCLQQPHVWDAVWRKFHLFAVCEKNPHWLAVRGNPWRSSSFCSTFSAQKSLKENLRMGKVGWPLQNDTRRSSSRRVVYRARVFNVCSVRHWFHTTNHSGFASLSKFNFLKKYARTFHWICKTPQRHSLFFCAKCSSQFLQWASKGFVGTVCPSPLPSANMRPRAKRRTAALHHICEEVQKDVQQRSIIYVRKCKTTYSGVASCMWGRARRRTLA